MTMKSYKTYGAGSEDVEESVGFMASPGLMAANILGRCGVAWRTLRSSSRAAWACDRTLHSLGLNFAYGPSILNLKQLCGARCAFQLDHG